MGAAQHNRRTCGVLRLRNVEPSQQRQHALGRISFDMDCEPVAIIGGGDDATALLEAVMGILPVAAGQIEFAGCDITNRSPCDAVLRGINYIARGPRTFHSLTVDEHLRIAGRGRHGIWSREQVYDVFPRLARSRDKQGCDLPAGEQRTLSVALALRPGARLLLVDQPAGGLDAREAGQVAAALRRAAAYGVAVLIADQDGLVAARLSCRRLALSDGGISRKGDIGGAGTEFPSAEVRPGIGATQGKGGST